ncbi:MAG: S9 family peptidase, partial [Verrucomicrobiota bacterium]
MKIVCSLSVVLLLMACSKQISPENSHMEFDQPQPTSRGHAESEDPHLWLEEVESEQALNWAREQNSKSVERLQSDARYEALYQGLLEIYEDPEKITRVTERDGYLYNFWRDAQHVQGLYRRTTLDSYQTGEPAWEPLID